MGLLYGCQGSVVGLNAVGLGWVSFRWVRYSPLARPPP